MKNVCVLLLLGSLMLFHLADAWNTDDTELATDDHAGHIDHVKIKKERGGKRKGVSESGGSENTGKRKNGKLKDENKGKRKKGYDDNKTRNKGEKKHDGATLGLHGHPDGLVIEDNPNVANREMTCNTNADCAPGHCCIPRKKKGIKVCKAFSHPTGKKCTDSCACSNGLECFAEKKDNDQMGKKMKKNKKVKKMKGVCKQPESSDLAHGIYLKFMQ